MAADTAWTAHLILAGLRLAFTAAPRLGQDPASLRPIAMRTRELLGPTSREYVALMLRCAPVPGVSLRERCRSKVGWRYSRSELYRRSHNAAVRVAAALNRERVPIPDGITQQSGGRLTK